MTKKLQIVILTEITEFFYTNKTTITCTQTITIITDPGNVLQTISV